MPQFNDADFPALLGVELYRPKPQYFVEAVTRPMVVHDFNAQPGAFVQLDKYDYWPADNSLTVEARTRGELQTIGTLNQRAIPKRKINLELVEITGPADPNNPATPSTLVISRQAIEKARRSLIQRNLPAFHQSIGSLTLLDDYQRWNDRIYTNQLLKSPNTYNPDEIPDGGTYQQGPPKFSVIRDLLTVVQQMQDRNIPTFEDGNYCCVCDPTFLKHLRQDPDFRSVAKYPGEIPVQGMYQVDPMGPMQIPFVSNPNSLIFGGGQINQAISRNQQPAMMPTGIVYEGVRFFSSTNLPREFVNLNYVANAPGIDPVRHPLGNRSRAAHIGMFFGPGAIGKGIGGNGAEVLRNNNDDFNRFEQYIWRVIGAWELIQPEFVTIARSYGD